MATNPTAAPDSWAAILEAARTAGCTTQLRALGALLITTSTRGCA